LVCLTTDRCVGWLYDTICMVLAHGMGYMSSRIQMKISQVYMGLTQLCKTSSYTADCKYKCTCTRAMMLSQTTLLDLYLSCLVSLGPSLGPSRSASHLSRRVSSPRGDENAVQCRLPRQTRRYKRRRLASCSRVFLNRLGNFLVTENDKMPSHAKPEKPAGRDFSFVKP